ncbi:MAG: arsenate reductase ArsC [Dehalococcoidia bacterium]|nr:arsenate reductase ArsC [Dehalococcoidia bacterium]
MRTSNVLFLCTGNSAHSQMAAACARTLSAGLVEAHSVGSRPAAVVNPLTVLVMQEAGAPFSGARPKHLRQFLGMRGDHIITMCDNARDACPVFPGEAQHLHWGFDDPAAAAGTPEERLVVFRRVRDEICDRLRVWLPESGALETVSR